MYTLKDIASFNFFSDFVDSNNSSILWILRPLLTKAFASAFYCFQICEKIPRQFKILAILYFYRFIIIFNLTLQQVLLLIELNEARNFVNKFPVCLFHLHLKIYYKNSLWRKAIGPSSCALSILYFSQGNLTNWKHSITIFWR